MTANSLQVAAKQQFDLSPQTFEQALTFAKYLADSDMVPKQYRGKPGDCLIAMQWGFEIGLKPLQALQSIAPINGKPNLYGDAGKALLLDAGCTIEEEDIETIKANGLARCKITRPGRPPTVRTFSIENAKTAGLWNKDGPWRNYPERQLAWRAFWFAARDAASDLLRGMGGAEEALDIPSTITKDMGQADEVRPTTVDALPLYDAAKFDHNLPGWSKKITSGEKTAEQLITWLQSKNRLTDDQVKRLRAVTVAEVVDAATGEITGNQGADDADAHPLELAMNKATTRDQLDLLADRIDSEAGSPDWVTYLQSVYHANVDRLDR